MEECSVSDSIVFVTNVLKLYINFRYTDTGISDYIINKRDVRNLLILVL